MTIDYGKGAAMASTAADGGAGTDTQNLDAGVSAAYTFDRPQSKVLVSSHPTTGPALLYIIWNDVATSAEVTASNWDAVIEPGQQIASPDGIMVSCVGLFAASDQTYQTDFSVRGFE